MQINPIQADALRTLATPALIVDEALMQRHIIDMQTRMSALGVDFRPHAKTHKCIEILRRQHQAGARSVTVSTLREAEMCFAAGYNDILYAVGLAPDKIDRVHALRAQGCDLKVVIDSLDAADALTASDRPLDVLIEVDCDGDRAGIEPQDGLLLAVASRLRDGRARVRGVMTHAGSSYQCRSVDQLAAIAERERAAAVEAAHRLRTAGFVCEIVSVGSTPTALSARELSGVTEMRAGVYVFHDLVMASIGVARPIDIALAVLATVIGHRRGHTFIDAGWTALSRDVGTTRDGPAIGYGLVCDLTGTPIDGLIVGETNQEHGVIVKQPSATNEAPVLPIGSRCLILPNHACATAGQFNEYHVPTPDGGTRRWPRFSGW